MIHGSYWPWLALFALGAYHGINPGMGWLFAVALGLQEKTSSAVVRALPPIALGHLASIGLAVAAVQLLQARLPGYALRAVTSVILVGFGLLRLFRSRHPRWATWAGMRVGFRDLTLWSFLMATAHGAGLMLVPIILSMPVEGHAHHAAMQAASGAMIASSGSIRWLMPVGIHTLGYVALTGLVSLIVYKKVGLTVLRHAWLNLDLIWALALVCTGVLTLLF